VDSTTCPRWTVRAAWCRCWRPEPRAGGFPARSTTYPIDAGPG
jgi:hypothetical protein